MDNNEIEAIVVALGGHKDAVGRRVVASLEEAQLRYHRLIIAADADVDGDHICILVLGMLQQLLPEMIRSGRVFVARAPLYRLTIGAKGDRVEYAYSDEERDQIAASAKGPVQTTRFKGLGEMNAPELKAACMDPATRRLLRVREDDPVASAQALSLILGTKAEPRRVWLEEMGFASEEQGA